MPTMVPWPNTISFNEKLWQPAIQISNWAVFTMFKRSCQKRQVVHMLTRPIQSLTFQNPEQRHQKLEHTVFEAQSFVNAGVMQHIARTQHHRAGSRAGSPRGQSSWLGPIASIFCRDQFTIWCQCVSVSCLLAILWREFIILTLLRRSNVTEYYKSGI